MDRKMKCDLCKKPMKYTEKTTMINKINKNIIDVCKECFNEFFNKSDPKN